MIRTFVGLSTKPIAQVAELMNVRKEEPVAFTRAGVSMIDRPIYAVIEHRRRAADLEERRDILSLLLLARTEEGEALTDYEIRSELLTLVLAGHETTANSLAWAWERLVRNPRAQAASSSRSAPATGAAPRRSRRRSPRRCARGPWCRSSAAG